MQAVARGLARHGLRLRPGKNTAHCPAARHDAELEAELRTSLDGHASYEPEGLVVLGVVAEGNYGTCLSAQGVRPEPIRKRTEAAEAFAAGLHRVLDVEIPGRARGPVWKLLCLVRNRALSNGLCVCPSGVVTPYAERLDAAVAGVAQRLAACPSFDRDGLWGRAIAQLREPRTHGGLSLPAACQEAPFAFLGTAIAVLPRAFADLVRDGVPVETAQQAFEQSGLLPSARDALQAVTGVGIQLDPWGMPCQLPDPVAGQPLALASTWTGGCAPDGH